MDPVNMQYTAVPLNNHNVRMQYHAVQWEDHFNHLITTLKDFTVLNIQTDITLITGNHKLPVHRLILSCYSSYVKEFLTDESLNCYILISDINESLLKALINFIYVGAATVPISSVTDWYKTTKLLGFDNFMDSGRSLVSENVTYFTCPQHRENILQYLWQSRKDSRDCDVILVTNNFTQSFAHSCILSACSRYLLNIFLRHTKKNKKKPYVLILQNVKSEDLEAVLEFCYRGTVSILEENINSVYDTAELLGVQDLCKKLTYVNPIVGKMLEIHEAGYTSDVISRIKTAHSISRKTEQYHQLQNIFQNCLEYEDLVDITLVKDKQSFTAHIVVLSAFSMYFKNLARYLQHNMKDAFVLIKDLRTQHLRAFLDYIYKGEAEFPGTTEVFCGIMSEWIDFTLLSISESETCQILSNATPIKQTTGNMLEDQSILSVYGTSNVVCQNIQQQENDSFLEDQNDSSIAKEQSDNMEKDTVSTRNIEEQKEMEADKEGTGEEKKKEASVSEDWSNLKNDCDNSAEDDTAERGTVQDGDDKDEEEEEVENKTNKRWKERNLVLTCYTCNRCFESRKHLREHLTVHPDGRIMKCNYCGKGFDRPSQMKLHLRIHTGSKPFSCKQCGRGFAAKSALRKHIDVHAKDKGKIFECAVCNKSFSRKEYLEEHIRTHTGTKPFECPICHKTFVGRTGLNHHKKTHVDADEKKDSVCEICGKSFTRHALWTHVKSHEKTHHCNHCNKCFSTASALRFHITGTHLGCRSYQCEVCGKSFIQKNHLIRHMKVHDLTSDDKNTRPYLCGKCPRTFKTESKLESHMKLEHTEPGERPYSCEICNKRFAGRSTVIYHRRAHTGERPHSCPTCGKTFMRPDALRQHIVSHTGERRHQCSTCSRKFASKHTLNKHIQSHKEMQNTVEKQGTSTCDVCHKSFQSETQFSIHSRIHNSCRPLRCHVCHKSFRYQDSLTKHLNIHTTHGGQEEGHSNVLSCMYAFPVCAQTFEPIVELDCSKENEQHNYTTETLVHNDEKISDTLQQYSIPPTAVSSSICISENKNTSGMSTRRPYSITIEGNLCCNTEGQNVNVITDNMGISLPPPPPPPPLPPSLPPTFHHLSQPPQALDIHPMVSLAASHIRDQQVHPHVDMAGNPSITTSSYTEAITKSFLFTENSSQLIQEIARPRLNR